MTIGIRDIGPGDDAFASWHAAIREAHLADRESAWWSSVESVRAYFGRPSDRTRHLAVAAFDRGICVGGAEDKLPLRWDVETMSVELGVSPAAQGRGVGARLASYVKELAVQHDRRIVQTELYLRPGLALSHTPGGRFAEKHGFRTVNTEDRLVLDLPADEGHLARLQQTFPRDDYVIRSWVDRCPDDLVAEWSRMRTHMDEDVPTGELTRTPQPVDVDRIREAERNFAEQGWTRLRTAALTADGRGAGYTEIYLSRHDTEFLVQDDTFVDRYHRGHRLGLRMKLANLRQLHDLPDHLRAGLRFLQTHTERHNTAMQRANGAFGFRRVDVLHELETDLTNLPA
ncbi:hypothetical protein [Flexivirga meconopsidis]|uniref:hypothetical protein n=1 Tax=Flexivirga meconopsidis TaxID=2977121 RepID=UPI00223EAD24|nr:hypothetical protein [Flexivirga meconopsidis]